MTPFDYLNSINSTKEKLESGDYNPYMVNRGLSYFYDTILFANEMNGNSILEADIQYQFYLKSISKKKRFSKWYKKSPDDSLTKIVCEYYQVSSARAQEYIELMPDSQKQELQELFYKGGHGK